MRRGSVTESLTFHPCAGNQPGPESRGFLMRLLLGPPAQRTAPAEGLGWNGRMDSGLSLRSSLPGGKSKIFSLAGQGKAGRGFWCREKAPGRGALAWARTLTDPPCGQSHTPLVGPLTKGLDGSSQSPVQPSVLPQCVEVEGRGCEWAAVFLGLQPAQRSEVLSSHRAALCSAPVPPPPSRPP